MEGIEIIQFPEEGYHPLMHYKEWRVAVLKFCPDLLLENIKTMQKHLETDEVFVLLKGSCTLFLAGDGEQIGTPEKVELKPGRIYNVKKGFWHNHIMSEEGEVLIIENEDTSDENSPIKQLDKEQVRKLHNL